MAEITWESREKYNKRFPDTMNVMEIAEELQHMNAQEAEEYDMILCDEIFIELCWNYTKYGKDDLKLITSSEEFKVLKNRSQNLMGHIFYDTWCAFIEDRKKDVKIHLHDFMQTYIENPPVSDDDDVSGTLLLGFKNAYPGFWQLAKKELAAVPHNDIDLQLCDVIDAFYNAPSNGEALDVLVDAYQKYPDNYIINEMLGVVYYDEKQYGNAAAAFERLYDEKTDSFMATMHSQDQINFYLGYANDKMKDRKTAITYYEKAIEIYPRCPFAANNLGYLYYRERQYDKAYAILKRCLDEKLDGDLTYATANFARLLCAMGRYSEAKTFMKNAPARIPKAIREKIEKAPDKDNEPVIISVDESTDNEENSEPVIKASIERKVVQFQSEKVLEDELTMRMEAGMEVFGLPLKIYRRRGEYGRQYIFPKGRLDLLTEDVEGNLYIIELKKDSGYDDAYKQTIEYIDWFQKHKARGKKVYGIICLNAPNKSLIESVRKDDRVKLFEYQISYSEIK